MTRAGVLKLLFALLSLVIAWQAQTRLTGKFERDGWILYGIAVVLFVAALGRSSVTRLAQGLVGAFVPDSRMIPVRRALLTASLLSALIGIAEFASKDLPSMWLFHLLAVLLFIAAFAPIPTLRLSAINPRPRSIGRLISILAILVFALLLRLWKLDRFPAGTWFDEAFNGNAAVRMLADSTYRPVFVESDTLPAHFIYLLALSFRMFGVSTASMRFVAVVFGVATVAFAYLLFRRWFDDRIALVAATMFAVMRYDLTFSRIAMHGVTTPAFELAALYFLDRLLERKRLADTAWLSLALGFGLGFYAPFRLFPLVLVAFAGGALIASLLRRVRVEGRTLEPRAINRPYAPSEFRLQFAAHLGVLILGVFVACAPVAQFALQSPKVFFSRQNKVSVFERRDEPDLAKALWNNTRKHFRMFNVRGDPNGRHNLPGVPMLDPFMGALGVLGFGYALGRWRDPTNALMLLLFFIMNLGGILTVDFEAPQSLRSVGVMPALVYFAVLPVAAIIREVARGFAPEPSRAEAPEAPGLSLSVRATLLAGILLLLFLVAMHNLGAYFNRQMEDPSAWAAHSIGQTLAAQEMNRLAATHDLIVSSVFSNHPTVRFLAPTVTGYQTWTVSDRLPFMRDSARDLALLLDPQLANVFNAARRYYPNGQFREHRSPKGGGVVMYEALVSANDLRAVRGVAVRYFAGSSSDGVPDKEEAVGQIELDWTRSRPLAGPFIAEFRGTLDVPQYGNYRFSVRGATRPSLWIDENRVGDDAVNLALGNHTLRLRVRAGRGKVELWWQTPNSLQAQIVPATALFRPPVSNSGLLGAYYSSPDWSGTPAFMRVDPEIALYFHVLPLPRPYSVEWKGRIYSPLAGTYRFATESIDDSRVSINGRVVLDNPGRKNVEGSAPLTRGWNDIAIRFADKTKSTHIHLYWTAPGGSREIVPSVYLAPPMGRYPTPEELAEAPKPLPLSEPPATALARPAPTSSPATFLPPLTAADLSLNPVLTIGTSGTGQAQFKEPHAIAMDGNGRRLYVVDTGNKRVQVLGVDGKFIGSIASGGQTFVDPFDVVVASTGEVVVLDSGEGWLYRFNPGGKPLGRVGGTAAQFYHPRGLSIDTQNYLYVADTGGSRVVKLSLDGQRLQVYGTKDTGGGRLSQPSDAAMDSRDTLFATDGPNKRIQVFHADGHFLFDFPIPPAGPHRGPHIAFAPDQTLFVTAPEVHKIQRYSRQGKLLGEWGGPGQQLGQLRLPTGIAVAGTVMWIVDTGNDRIQRWEIRPDGVTDSTQR